MHALAQDPEALLQAALGGSSPFPWQARLMRRFMDDNLPRTLDLPTGLGKTSVMAIWLAARVSGAAAAQDLRAGWASVESRRRCAVRALRVKECVR